VFLALMGIGVVIIGGVMVAAELFVRWLESRGRDGL
jgi:hypothetical protein